MTFHKETEAEAMIRRTIRLSCEGLGVAPGEAEDMASRAIHNLRLGKTHCHILQDAGGVAARPPKPAKLLLRPKYVSTPQKMWTDSNLVDHLIARWQDL